MSKGEDKIKKILTENKVKFKQEVSFPDLKSLKKGYLRFDFVVYDKKGKIICAIEMDGEQHFRRIPHFQKTEMDFKRTQEWDRRKNSYCLSRNIPLIRIPYWDYDIITFERIFSEPTYRVTNKFHTDLLERR